MKELLEVKSLSKSFKKGKEEVNILNNINFKVEKGKFLSVVGPSGCGKSTLLNLIAGFDTDNRGKIVLKDKDILGPGPSRIMVFQGFDQLFPWKTIFDNVVFPLKINRKDISAKKRKELAKEYLQMVKLEDYLDYYPHEISGGMKQRTAIARALVMEPKVLLMDEPFGSLDIQTKSELHNILIQIWTKTKTTIIFVSHDIEEAVMLSDRILVMGRFPLSIKDDIVNTLDRPRDKLSVEFNEIVKKIYDKIKE